MVLVVNLFCSQTSGEQPPGFPALILDLIGRPESSACSLEIERPDGQTNVGVKLSVSQDWNTLEMCEATSYMYKYTDHIYKCFTLTK